MKEILCFGDSNTHGYMPGLGTRYPYDVRWPGVLARLLGAEYHIVEEGMDGRTTAFEDAIQPHRSALGYLYPCLKTHAPLDLVILMLGTNDMKVRYQAQAVDIAEGARSIVREIRRLHQEIRPDWMPQILLVSPLLVGEKIRDGLSDCSEGFGGERAYWLSRELAPLYQQVAREEGCHFLDAGSVASAGTADALHLEEEGHRDLAAAMEAKVREIFQEA